MPKTDWYQVANSYGEEPMVAMRDEGPHRVRKKMLAQPYLKTTIRNNQCWADAQQRLTETLVSALDKLAMPSSGVDFYDLAFAWSVDSITEYLFGPSASLDLLADIPKARQTREAYENQRAYQFLPLPSVLLHYMGYRPEIPWIRGMQQATQDKPNTVYQHLSQGVKAAREQPGPVDTPLSAKEGAIVMSEMQDHMVAGIDTSAVVLTTCAWLLSLPSNQVWQRRLREELHSAGSPTSAARLEPLPLLDAIVKEVLRLHAPVAGGQPRKTPKSIDLGPSGYQITVPAGVTVHSQAQTLHRSSAYRDPGRFDPGRWLHSSPEALAEMERWYWPFGSGSRACIGAQLGMDNLKIAVASLYGGFSTEVVDRSTFALSQGVVAMPVSQNGYHLRLRVRREGR
ncbi:hypothetical protein LTR85_010056 [Meristemomyces frigidus]|nr:hypothetical protein LTR85_010056 [Meristemomyces frigidus]